MQICNLKDTVSGAFVTLGEERYYAISNVDKMSPFFISLVSDSDHWMFIASNGGLTAGRVSPETALFPYTTVDKIYDSAANTGSKTLLRVQRDGHSHVWEPFNRAHDRRFITRRNLYKSFLGNKLLFEEINDDLQLVFRYTWSSSDAYGFVRESELTYTGESPCEVQLLDGLQDIMPAGTPRAMQTNSSYLVDAYKWNELEATTGLALFSLFSGISDRAEPCESLRATTVFGIGLEDSQTLLSTRQLDNFRDGQALIQEPHTRGIRGAYLLNASLALAPRASQRWRIVANVEQTQSDAVALMHALRTPLALNRAITRSVARGTDALARIMAAADGFQQTAEETVSAHHYANVMFNVMRGGIVDNQYQISARAFAQHVRLFDRNLYDRQRAMLEGLPAQLDCALLMSRVAELAEPQFERLAYEYLPITFGRRHGDPSRPWNQFAIRLTDEQGERLLSYQGNWRDIFQNWEALLFSYPAFIEHVIAKFVNASTIDGYNPYRITNEGIDWEVEDNEDPWSYIGYWGDHQIIYLQKLLELSRRFHPDRLQHLLQHRIFSYANVPYRIKPFDALLDNAKSTVEYDHALAQKIEAYVARLGNDGKLLLDTRGEVYQVNLLEKLLVPLLAKLGNLVIDGGIWLNTQRPEWNDANNALVGQGLSMVTLYYLRRYIDFLQTLLLEHPDTTQISHEVSVWLTETATALKHAVQHLGENATDARQRHQLLTDLGMAASRYRLGVYESGTLSGLTSQPLASITDLLKDAMTAIDHSIRANQRADGLYHAYNLLGLSPDRVNIDPLYPMLEGQVAVLSCGAIAPAQAVELLQAMFESDLYRPDQQSFLLYPDRQLPTFLQKNRVPAEAVEAMGLVTQMLEANDTRIIQIDAQGIYRFHPDLTNVNALNRQLDTLLAEYGEAVNVSRAPLAALYEQVFNHKAFTGRSGGMFGFEGVGSIYWHMVAKLLLAVQENFFGARAQDADVGTLDRLAQLYYRVRKGLGFNKTPAEYGAFPTDPYSHTPGHIGAQQPGMTGQVKEEVLSRFGELGVCVDRGTVRFDPALLRAREFVSSPQPLRYVDVHGHWHTLRIPVHALGFTWCQVPIVYHLGDAAAPSLTVSYDDNPPQTLADIELPRSVASELFQRSGRIARIDVHLTTRQLYTR